ncbi:unnamed protein product [Peronospora farinosa]|uniref:Kinesin-like protein n=1 Tax=Peronospora farinosa TaxID=134698 RepID=A0AAV0SP39_9STRA|nr:unnamed protein product [Peronospora farinosa]CAI5704829.1 unnamed protein product [Peronospora farinosa]
MAIHVSKYDEFSPEELLERIAHLLKEQETTKRHGLSSCRSTTSNELTPSDTVASSSLAAFQSRLLELEYDQKRLYTKLEGSKALQMTLTEENTALRVQIEEMKQQAVYMEHKVQEKEVLKCQTLHLRRDVVKWKQVAVTTLREIKALKQELQLIKQQVKNDCDATLVTLDDAMALVVENVNGREQMLQQNYLVEKREREAMAEKYYELSGKIRVFCRVRPGRKNEEETKPLALVIPRPNNLLVSSSGKEFAFDQVFGPQSTQMEVYAQIEPLIVSFTDGYNACIMAYGQTGSGKTHTMMGYGQNSLEHRADELTLHSNAGVIPRALQQVFAMVKMRRMTYVDTLRVSMVEIYNDQILDLLHEDSTGGGKNTVARNETEITARDVSDYRQVDAVMRDGNANRNIASTRMNLESSRSHALVFLHLDSKHRETQEVCTSTLCLVDLAGSERISRSQVKGDRLRETQHINKSLAALGDVVYALQHKAKHTPYRNSKLTYMLRDMISGQAKTLLMLQLSPDTADVEETTCSLQFGARVSQVQMGAVRPSVESGALCKLQEENRSFEAKTLALETQLNDLQQQCLQQGEKLHKAQSSKKKFERQLRLPGERQRGDKAANDLDHHGIPSDNSSASPSRPPSFATSAKSSRRLSSTTLARSARSIRPPRSAQSSASSSRQPFSLPSTVLAPSRLSGTTRAPSSPALSPTVSRLRRSKSTTDREERRKSLSAASLDRGGVDPDLRRKSLSTTSASKIVDYDNQRESLSTLQNRSMSGLATPRSMWAEEASTSDSRMPLHPPFRTRPADSPATPASATQSTSASRVSKPRPAKAAGSSKPLTSSRSSVPSTIGKLKQTLHRTTSTPSTTSSRTPTGAAAAISKTGSDMRRPSMTRNSLSSTSDASARRSMGSSHSSSGWK